MLINASAPLNGSGEKSGTDSMASKPSVDFMPRSSTSGDALSSIQGFAEFVRNSAAVEAAQGSREVMETAAGLISDFLASSGRTLNVSVDASSDALVLRVMDKMSGDVIRQIPSDEALMILRYLQVTGSALVNRVA